MLLSLLAGIVLILAVYVLARVIPVSQRGHAGPAGGHDEVEGRGPRRLGGHQEHQELCLLRRRQRRWQGGNCGGGSAGTGKS